jgi:hypothetical protein
MRYLIVFIFTIILTGCGKEEIPPPPTAHALLAKKLFDNLERKNHEAAVKRIQKVRAIDSSNEFLVQLEEREYCNHYIEQVQKQLDANNLPQALSKITEARKKYPLNHNLLAIDEELKQLRKLQTHIRLLNTATSSREMNIQINAISQFIKKYPAGKALLPLLRKRIKKAFKQKLYERERARFDLLCDLKAARDTETPDQNLNDTLIAVLTADNAATVNKKEHTKPNLLD